MSILCASWLYDFIQDTRYIYEYKNIAENDTHIYKNTMFLCEWQHVFVSFCFLLLLLRAILRLNDSSCSCWKRLGSHKYTALPLYARILLYDESLMIIGMPLLRYCSSSDLSVRCPIFVSIYTYIFECTFPSLQSTKEEIAQTDDR